MHACSYTVGGKKAARLPWLWTLNYFLILLHLSWQVTITYHVNNLLKKNSITLSPDSPQQNSLKSLCKSARTLVIVKPWLTHDNTKVTLCYDKEQHNMSWSWKFRILHLMDMFILYLKHGFIIHRKHKIRRAAFFSAAVSPACMQLRRTLAAVYL